MSVSDAAQQVGMSENDLRSLNSIPPRMLIKAGSALMVPRTTTTRQDVSSHLADNGQLSLTPEAVTRRTTVRAGRGETVATIARRYQLAAASIADWNDVRANAAFKLGQQVVVYLPVRAATKAPGNRSHAIRAKSGKQPAGPSRRGGTPSKVKRR